MNLKMIFAGICLVFLFNNFTIAQTQAPQKAWVVNSLGDTLKTTKIFDRITNEDQVAFRYNGKRKVLQAKDVGSYFKKSRGRTVSITTADERKLVSIILEGKVTLARSTTARTVDVFFLKVDQKWTRLDPKIKDLKPLLSSLIPDFDQVIRNEKIFYNLIFVGEVISRYNASVDEDYANQVKYQFQDRAKMGVFVAAGAGILNSSEISDDQAVSATTSFGFGTHIQYSRLYSAFIQMSYTQNNWSLEGHDFKLRTIDFAPFWCIPIASKTNNFKVFGALGMNVKINVASELEGPIYKKDMPIGISGVSLGLDGQVHASIGEHFDIFCSYQYMPSMRSKNYALVVPFKKLKFKTSNIRLGAFYYL